MSDQLIVSMQAETLLARLAGSGDRLRGRMRREVERLSIEVQTLVKQKLTGPVLHVRTGTLRRSINRLITESPESVLAQVGTNVRYAAIHEYGYEGPVPVRAHARRTPSGGVTQVRSFTRQVRMPKRSFLVSTLTEETPRIRAQLRRAALEALQ